MRRRDAVVQVATGVAALLLAPAALAQAATRSRAAPAQAAPRQPMTVYKSASCGCCVEWVKHMERTGFAVTIRDTEDVDAIATQMGVPTSLRSCHTAVSGRYVISGHVPGDLVQQLLRERGRQVVGLAVPGMPAGSPGMESPRPEKYQVIEWRRDGTTRVYASR